MRSRGAGASPTFGDTFMAAIAASYRVRGQDATSPA
jgi:hypothetical protein